MIKIRSNKDLPFDPVGRKEGIVEIFVESYSRNPQQKTFTLYLVDYLIHEFPGMVTEEVPAVMTEDGVIEQSYVREVPGMIKMITENRRYKTYTDAELIGLATTLGVESESIDKIIVNLDELFRRGLLAITQQECLEGKGIYMSEVNDWEIVNEN